MQKYRDVVMDEAGNAIADAVVTVAFAAGGAAPTIYSDNGITPITSALTAADGSFFFYAANGRYTLTVTPPSGMGAAVTVPDVLLEDITGASAVPFTPAGAIAATDVQAALVELDAELTALNGAKAALNGSASEVFEVAPATAVTHAPAASQLTGRNVIVNGGCEISQVNAATLITPLTASWPIDNVYFTASIGSKLQTQQVSNLLGSLGAVAALNVSVLASYIPIITDNIVLRFPIEGVNFARFQYGSVNAKVGSLQFKARASVAGAYSGSIVNYSNNRSYPFAFALAANVDTLITIPNIPGDTGGAWVGATNAGAAYVNFDLGSGNNARSTADTWQAGGYSGVTGSTDLVAQVNGSTLTISDVQFEQSPFCTQFERKLYDQVLRDCKRYLPLFNSSGQPLGVGYESSTTAASLVIPFNVPTRIAITGIVTTFGGLFVSDPVAGDNSLTAAPTIIHSGIDGVRIGLSNSLANWAVSRPCVLTTNSTKIYFTGAQI